jgi:hypothetical protein
VGLALIFRPCLCVMAKRLRDVCCLTVQEILDEHIAKKLV